MASSQRNGRIGARLGRTTIGLALAATLVLGAVTPAGAHSSRPWRKPHHLDHIFVIVLENYKTEDVTATAMPYLFGVTQGGATLDAMYGVDHASLSNYIAMTSGNPPNASTKADCFQYDCMFEAPSDRNLGDQLEETGRTWKAYMESMPAPCTHPTVSGSLDPYLVGYATRHNPFMYYRDIVGPDISVKTPRCEAHDVPLTQLGTDLANRDLPNYAMIVPNTCNDAHDRGANCALPTADAWLAANVPAILASKDFGKHGALIVTFDESEGADTRGCCGNSAGGKIFTAVVSRSVANPGTHTSTPYNHYSVLRTIEDNFGLDCLGHACDASTQPFGSDVWLVRNHHHRTPHGHDGDHDDDD